jgi:hypothetical protein
MRSFVGPIGVTAHFADQRFFSVKGPTRATAS